MFVTVRFKKKTTEGFEASDYYFKNDFGLTLDKGTHVLTDTRNGYQYGIVTGFYKTAPVVVTKSIITIIDVKKYEEEIEKRKVVQRIEKELEEQIKALKKRKELEQYAGMDSRIDMLLKQLKELEG